MNTYRLSEAGDGFWARRMKLVRDTVVPMQHAILENRTPDAEPSYAIENFRIAAGLADGEFHGLLFQDSDLAKWIEAAAYCLKSSPDKELERQVDAVVDIIGKAQQSDGYLNTYFIIKEPGKRWTNLRECHELYCAGHLIEAAVAYYEATGKPAFLDTMKRVADHIDSRFGPAPDQLHGYPGHPEIELALIRLYHAANEPRYFRLAQYFIDQRGTQPYYYEEEYARIKGEEYFGGLHELGREYAQWHAPVREQRDAIGHAVRGLYLYAAMARCAAETNDSSLAAACDALWDSAVNRRMYITGGFGATHHGEAFASDYELPNDTAYAETCASVAFILFARGMLNLKRDGAVADEMERALYNGVLPGMQLDGTRFFYVNPLEAVRGVSGVSPEHRHALPERQKWFACACCPPNLARLIASLPDYAYDADDDSITIHQYLGGVCELPTAGGVAITHDSNYPWDGHLSWAVCPSQPGVRFALHIRVPRWCKDARFYIDGAEQPVEGNILNGYITITRDWPAAATVVLDLPLIPRKVYSNSHVRENAGRVALMCGPLVYCLESTDNPAPLSALRITKDAPAIVGPYDEALLGGARMLSVEGERLICEDGLYSDSPPAFEKITLKAIPYYAWANRGLSDMSVWICE